MQYLPLACATLLAACSSHSRTDIDALSSGGSDDALGSPDAGDVEARQDASLDGSAGADAVIIKDTGFTADDARLVADASTAADLAAADQRSAADVAPLPGNHYYVATMGNDGNDGSAAHPWATITHAAVALKLGGAGATVHVAPGTYNENVVTKRSGMAGARVRYLSDSRWAAKIAGPAGLFTMGWQNTGDFSDVIGFDIAGTSCIGLGQGGSNQKALGNRVHNTAPAGCGGNGGAGIDSYVYSKHDDDIIGNVVFDVGASDPLCGGAGHWFVHGIYHSINGGNIKNNLVVNSCGVGIHLWHAASHAIIVNNTVLFNKAGGILVGSGDAPCTTGGCPGGADYVIVRNNIVAFNGHPTALGWGIVEEGVTGSHNQYSNNLGYQNKSGNFAFNNGLHCTSCLTTDPLFVKGTGLQSGDYRVGAGSPAVNSGTATDAPDMDLEGGGRPVGKLFDVGAYEADAPPAAWPFYP